LGRLIGLAASAFYAWLRRGPNRRAQDEALLIAEIREIFEQSGKTYGSPRIHAELCARGRRIGRKRIARPMREQGLIVPRKKRRLPVTTDSRHDHPIAPNLLGHRLEAARPDETWLADITYVPTGEGWLYVTAIPRREYPPLLRKRMIGIAEHYGDPRDRRLGHGRSPARRAL
jgi:transposase InsO family protein